MEKVIFVKACDDFVLQVRFADGAQGRIEMKDRLFGPVFEPLNDPKLFAQASIDEFGAVCWPNGADLAPDALYERLKQDSQVA